MSNLFDYSQTPASNNSTPPDGAPEGMAPSAVNNTMRQMMAASAGAFKCYTAGGSANAQTVTMDPTLTALSDKVRVAFIPVANNTGACTLAINGLTATAIKMLDGTDPPAGALNASGIALVQHNGTNFRLLNPAFTIGTLVQAWDADLDALAALASTGLATRTASNTWAQRTITGTSAEITATNGDGVSGNPTLSLPTALTFTGKTITGGTFASPTLSGTVAGTPTFSGAVVLSTPDINGGTVDGARIGASSAAQGNFAPNGAFNPSTAGIENAAIIGTGSSGGGMVLKDGSGRVGIWAQNFGAEMIFGIGTASGATIKATLGNGLQIGSPTGGDKGAGTLNATGVYVNNSAALVSGGALGTPSSVTLTNGTGLPVAGISDYESSSYTGTAVGLTTSPTGTVYYTRIGNKVTLKIPVISGTTDAGAFQISGAPASIRPTATTGREVVYVRSSSASAIGTVKMTTGGILDFGVGGDEDDFSGSSGSLSFQFSYNLNQS